MEEIKRKVGRPKTRVEEFKEKRPRGRPRTKEIVEKVPKPIGRPMDTWVVNNNGDVFNCVSKVMISERLGISLQRVSRIMNKTSKKDSNIIISKLV